MDDITIKNVVKSQFKAGLAMLKNSITQCSDELWSDDSYSNRFGNVAYHVLFFVDFYSSQSEATFKPWHKQLQGAHELGEITWNEALKDANKHLYSKEEMLEYIDYILTHLDQRVDELDLNGESGFEWLPFNKMELQFYNIRHLQHHTAQLIERIREKQQIGIQWVGRGK